jgi:hypothetical protein
MSEHSPDVNLEATSLEAPEIVFDDLLEVDSYENVGMVVRLMLNKNVNIAYVEVEDRLTDRYYAIPIPPGQKSQKIFNDPMSYLRLAKISAAVQLDKEGRVFKGRDDEALLEMVTIPQVPEILKHRSNDGIDTTLFLDGLTGQRIVSVFDTKANLYFSLEPRSDAEAEDMYIHPYAYLGQRGSEAVNGFEQESEFEDA